MLTLIHTQPQTHTHPHTQHHLVGPAEDGEGENTRGEPCIQDILICNTGSEQKSLGRILHSTVNDHHLREDLTLSEGDLVSGDVEALGSFISGVLLCPPTHPVMTIHVLEDEQEAREMGHGLLGQV